MPQKPIKDLPKDIRLALSKAVTQSAKRIVNDLKEQGPHFTGQFEQSWDVVELGQSLDPLEPRISRNPQPRQVTPVTVPYRDTLCDTGLTIYNRTDYQAIATDQAPGRWKGSIPPNTAPENWFTTYVNGGGLDSAVEKGVSAELKKLGQ